MKQKHFVVVVSFKLFHVDTNTLMKRKKKCGENEKIKKKS